MSPVLGWSLAAAIVAGVVRWVMEPADRLPGVNVSVERVDRGGRR